MKEWLNVYCNRRVLILLGFGFSSGLPLALTRSTLQAWMATEGVDLRVIGLFSLVGLPYALKVFWAPLMDRFSLPFLGRRKGWIFVTQLMLALAILGLSVSSPASTPWAVAMLAVFIAFTSASQDIVVDAYRADILRERELGAGAATTVIGARAALIVSGAFALILASRTSWATVYTLMAGLMCMNTLFTLAAPAPTESVTPPRSLREAVIGPLASYFERPGAVEMLLFIMVFKLSDNMAGTMTTPFLLDIGFTLTEVGTVNKLFGMLVTLLGAVAGGAVIAKIGVNRSLWIFAFLQAFSNLSFGALAVIGRNSAAMIASVGVENLCGGMGTAAFVAFLTSLCDKRFTATQYALLTSVMAIGPNIAGVPTGFMVHALGWPLFYGASALGALPGILLLPRFAPWKTKEDNLAAPIKA
jgi:PAT family beta-lactamase induction signal transducer AmpG